MNACRCHILISFCLLRLQTTSPVLVSTWEEKNLNRKMSAANFERHKKWSQPAVVAKWSNTQHNSYQVGMFVYGTVAIIN